MRRDWSIGLIRPTSLPSGSARTRRRKPGRRLQSGGAHNIHSGSPPTALLPGHQSMQIGGYLRGSKFEMFTPCDAGMYAVAV
jgi:hypothetical protein